METCNNAHLTSRDSRFVMYVSSRNETDLTNMANAVGCKDTFEGFACGLHTPYPWVIAWNDNINIGLSLKGQTILARHLVKQTEQ